MPYAESEHNYEQMYLCPKRLKSLLYITGRSNIEYTEHNKKSEQDALVRMLAENSAGFIATINKDDYELR